MNVKSLLYYLLGFFNPLEIIPLIIAWLEAQAAKTVTLVDDAAVAALKAAAMKIWPDLFE